MSYFCVRFSVSPIIFFCSLKKLFISFSNSSKSFIRLSFLSSGSKGIVFFSISSVLRERVKILYEFVSPLFHSRTNSNSLLSNSLVFFWMEMSLSIFFHLL